MVVLDENGATLFDSLTASRTLLGNPAAVDILRNVLAISVSEDQKWIALMLNNSDVAVGPAGERHPRPRQPDGGGHGNGREFRRDISFDAAGNIHYVSSGQGLYRVLSPGGRTVAITAKVGSTYYFTVHIMSDLVIGRSGEQVTLEWPNGILEESTSLTGPWSDSANQTSPLFLSPTNEAKFFRLRGF